MKRTLLAFLFGAALAVSSAALASADVAPEGDRATSFEAVSGAEGESVPGGALMVGAYGVLWLFIGLYVFRLGRTQRALEQEVGALEQRLARVERAEA